MHHPVIERKKVRLSGAISQVALPQDHYTHSASKSSSCFPYHKTRIVRLPILLTQLSSFLSPLRFGYVFSPISPLAAQDVDKSFTHRSFPKSPGSQANQRHPSYSQLSQNCIEQSLRAALPFLPATSPSCSARWRCDGATSLLHTP